MTKMYKDKKKLKVLYDAAIIESGCRKGSGRSGIYFTALNLLKEFAKNENIEFSLYCNIHQYGRVKKVLEKELPGMTVDIITDKSIVPLKGFYRKLKHVRNIAKLRKKSSTVLKVNLITIWLKMGIFFADLYHRIFKYGSCKKFDAFLSPFLIFPKNIKKLKMKKYLILYDIMPVLFPEYYAGFREKGSFWFDELIKSLNKDDYYFAISEATKNDYLNNYKEIDEAKICTTLLACNKSFIPKKDNIEVIKQKYGIPHDKKYIFSLCTLEPRKNLIRAVRTFIQFVQKNNVEDLVFVLGGGQWDFFIKKLEEEVSNLGDYKDKIIKAGYIEDEDVASLYSNAEWFVYTSQYEGFGLPPLEAMSCGCPVISSNISSLPEVVGDSALTIDWDSDEQHVEAYEKYYFNPALREEYAKKGLERSKMFSWKKCVDRMIFMMKKPDISVIIPVLNHFELTKQCIESINSSNKDVNYEIIIADDGSTDDTINIEKYFDNVRLIKTHKTVGFLLNVKNAVDYARGDYIMLMNNDMIAKPDFLKNLYGTMTRNKKMGVVGALILNDDNTIQEAGCTVYTNGATGGNLKYNKLSKELSLYDVNYCSGCGIMFLKSDYDKVGGFDERYVPAYYEDVDLCYSIKYLLKKRIVCEPKAQIVHLGGRTYKDSAIELSKKNKSLFLDKWCLKLTKVQYETVNPDEKNSFIQNLFSIRNKGKHKVVTMCFVKISFRMKKN